ncbi:MAG: hypothetical protein KatS3mg054_1211 [Chloroflexus sp.]|nr:MAG: hypothetical protein KatS3mg054_1211 [Chloroflexus sp.]
MQIAHPRISVRPACIRVLQMIPTDFRGCSGYPQIALSLVPGCSEITKRGCRSCPYIVLERVAYGWVGRWPA